MPLRLFFFKEIVANESAQISNSLAILKHNGFFNLYTNFFTVGGHWFEFVCYLPEILEHSMLTPIRRIVTL